MILSVMKSKSTRFKKALEAAQVRFRTIKGPFASEDSVLVDGRFWRKAVKIWLRFVKEGS